MTEIKIAPFRCSNPECSKRVNRKDREYCAACWRRLTPEGRADGSARQRAYQQRVKEHFAAESP
jgi:hypothetical protein